MSAIVDEASNRMRRATDQLRAGVHKSEIDFKGLAEAGLAAIDEIVSRMTVGEKREFCAGPWCATCVRECELAGER